MIFFKWLGSLLRRDADKPFDMAERMAEEDAIEARDKAFWKNVIKGSPSSILEENGRCNKVRIITFDHDGLKRRVWCHRPKGHTGQHEAPLGSYYW